MQYLFRVFEDINGSYLTRFFSFHVFLSCLIGFPAFILEAFPKCLIFLLVIQKNKQIVSSKYTGRELYCRMIWKNYILRNSPCLYLQVLLLGLIIISRKSSSISSLRIRSSSQHSGVEWGKMAGILCLHHWVFIWLFILLFSIKYHTLFLKYI